jgi:hypothetical protein
MPKAERIKRIGAKILARAAADPAQSKIPFGRNDNDNVHAQVFIRMCSRPTK